MRVITGSARGRRLETLSGNDVRPTTDVVKEAVFSIIQFYTEGRCFLDAFAGSGQMGIEALSRGAEKAVFLDSSRRSMSVIKKNISLCGFSDRSETLITDTVSFLSSTGMCFDTVFLDPPYNTGLLEQALAAAPRGMKPGGFIICEHPREEKLPESSGGFRLKKSYRYGKIMISVYTDEKPQND